MTERRAMLFGLAGWPITTESVAAVKANAEEARTSSRKPKLFYVWVFSWAHEDYIPIGVFNTGKEAEALLEEHVRPNSGAVLELAWDEFTAMATTQSLGKVAAALEKLGVKI